MGLYPVRRDIGILTLLAANHIITLTLIEALGVRIIFLHRQFRLGKPLVAQHVLRRGHEPCPETQVLDRRQDPHGPEDAGSVLVLPRQIDPHLADGKLFDCSHEHDRFTALLALVSCQDDITMRCEHTEPFQCREIILAAQANTDRQCHNEVLEWNGVRHHATPLNTYARAAVERWVVLRTPAVLVSFTPTQAVECRRALTHGLAYGMGKPQHARVIASKS